MIHTGNLRNWLNVMYREFTLTEMQTNKSNKQINKSSTLAPGGKMLNTTAVCAVVKGKFVTHHISVFQDHVKRLCFSAHAQQTCDVRVAEFGEHFTFPSKIWLHLLISGLQALHQDGRFFLICTALHLGQEHLAKLSFTWGTTWRTC